MTQNVIELDADDFIAEPSSFFALAPTDALSELLGRYRLARRQIAGVAAYLAGAEAHGVMQYFLEGNASRERGQLTMKNSAEQLFREKGAVAALDATYWSRALALTDVLDLMPQSRRTEWNQQIREQTCPHFEDETVRATLRDLLGMRGQFFAERVDGIFRGLSGEHVTNAPEAFGKRMIVARVMTYYNTIEHDRAGLINDLRCVIARFMGRDEPKWTATRPVLESMQQSWGEWVSIDGGALRIRLYKKGTAHLEVHPDMAWRLNQVLASMYPMAIPAEFRARPKRRTKDVDVIQRPLPFQVLEILAGYEQAYELDDPEAFRPQRVEVPNTLRAKFIEREQPQEALREAERILEALGGVPEGAGRWRFIYRPQDVLRDIIVSGCLPETVSHQYYATGEKLARACAELAQIGDDDTVLEPSAGQGGLARFLPKERTACVELSGLHVAILKAKGYDAIEADFIAWAASTTRRWTRVVMNPPYSDGRAVAHVEAAGSLLAPGGRLVAILPASLRGRDDLLPGMAHSWSTVYENEFPGTSARVAILVATRGQR
jgi:hypothetical protein